MIVTLPPPPPPDPVSTVILKVAPLPFVKVIVFKLTEAVVIALGVKDAVEEKLELTAFKTYEAVKVLVAQLAVPNNEPVNEVAFKEPVNPYEPVN